MECIETRFSDPRARLVQCSTPRCSRRPNRLRHFSFVLLQTEFVRPHPGKFSFELFPSDPCRLSPRWRPNIHIHRFATIHNILFLSKLLVRLQLFPVSLQIFVNCAITFFSKISASVAGLIFFSIAFLRVRATRRYLSSAKIFVSLSLDKPLGQPGSSKRSFAFS